MGEGFKMSGERTSPRHRVSEIILSYLLLWFCVHEAPNYHLFVERTYLLGNMCLERITWKALRPGSFIRFMSWLQCSLLGFSGARSLCPTSDHLRRDQVTIRASAQQNKHQRRSRGAGGRAASRWSMKWPMGESWDEVTLCRGKRVRRR